MKEIIVYRNKQTNKITNIQESNKHCTDENIALYNNNEKYGTKVEKVVLQEDSLEQYLWDMKTITRRELFDELRDIQEAISDLGSSIDDKLCDLENMCEEEE